jgi:hypothetical protein
MRNLINYILILGTETVIKSKAQLSLYIITCQTDNRTFVKLIQIIYSPSLHFRLIRLIYYFKLAQV